MVLPSTQQAVDRIVGTAIVLGVSVVAVRWLSTQSNSSKLLEDKDSHVKLRRPRKVPWWLTAIAFYRRKKDEHPIYEDKYVNAEDVIELTMDDESGVDCEHRGSCQCGSVNFVLRGPNHLQAVESKGKIRYPHIRTTAGNFQLLSGADDMRFYYSDDAADTVSNSSSIASDVMTQPSSANGFCGNCGVHILHAPDRSSDVLEVNANCLEGEIQQNVKLTQREPSSSSHHPRNRNSSGDNQIGKWMNAPSPSSSSLSSAMEVERTEVIESERGMQFHNTTPSSAQPSHSLIETVSENEPFLGSGSYSSDYHRNFWENLDDRHRKESISSSHTYPESFETTIMSSTTTNPSIGGSDDFSMGSSSITAASTTVVPIPQSTSSGQGAHSTTHSSREGLPPLYPSSMSLSNGSVKTLPPRWGEPDVSHAQYSPGGQYRSSGGASVGADVSSNWSVASIDSNLDMGEESRGNRTVSPRMRDQLKYYMSRHMGERKSNIDS